MNPSFYLVVLLSCGLTLAQPGNPGCTGDPDNPDAQLTPLEKQQMLERNAAWKMSIGELLDEYFRLMERVGTLEEHVGTLKSPRVAFSVTDPTPTIADSDDVTLQYKTVFTNIGSDYNTDTGIFLVEAPGMYYFTFFFHTMNRKFGPLTGLELRVNGDPKVKSIEQVGGGDYGDSAGNAIILDLVAGDQVTVVLKQDMCIKDEEYINTFTGFLLQPQLLAGVIDG